MKEYFHSVRLDESKCKGCTNCIKGCPTEAIRVRNGKAHILVERCIDCGECIRNCPEHAKYAITDIFPKTGDFIYRIAIPAPSFFGQFASKISDQEIIATLKLLGFDDVFEVALGAEYVSMAHRKYLEREDIVKPAISPACPAVLRLIQVKFPSLIPNLMMIEPPMSVTAYLAKSEYSKTYGVKYEDIGVFFISPCPAKVTASKQPVAGADNVDGVLSMSEVYGLVRRNYKKLEYYPELLENSEPQASYNGLSWARPGGESLGMSKDVTHVHVQGISHVSKVLEQIEMGKLEDVDFLEMQACTGGCLGGPLTVEDPFVAKVYLNNRAELRKSQKEITPQEYEALADSGSLFVTTKIEAREIMQLDNDVSTALEKLEEVERITAALPGLDCGACGAPTCRSLAEDIVQGEATRTDCTIELRSNVQLLAEELLKLAKHLPPTIEDKGEDKDEFR